jgi:hypothetical protein
MCPREPGPELRHGNGYLLGRIERVIANLPPAPEGDAVGHGVSLGFCDLSFGVGKGRAREQLYIELVCLKRLERVDFIFRV